MIIRSTKKEDGDFCLGIWIDDEMRKYMIDPPREKAGKAYIQWKETVEEYSGCYYFLTDSKETDDYIDICNRDGKRIDSVLQKKWSKIGDSTSAKRKSKIKFY